MAVTLKMLQQNAAKSIPQRVALELMLHQFSENPYSTFVATLEKALDWVIQELAKNPQLYQNKGEDSITEAIIIPLKGMGFAASHDTHIGGHGDIVIEGIRDFLWLGEAKVHKDYDWLLKGFNQLSTRYSTGSSNQNHGGMIIYSFNKRTDHMMEKWGKTLLSGVAGVACTPCDSPVNAFRSIHIHERTGVPYNVRHVPVSLYFSPQDN